MINQKSLKMYKIQRAVLFVAIAVVVYLLIQKWRDDFHSVSEISNVSEKPSISEKVEFGSSGSSKIQNISENRGASGNEIEVITDSVIAKISLDGGDVTSLKLLKYDETEGSSEPLSLMQVNNKITYVAQSGVAGKNGPDKANSRAKYTAEYSQYKLAPGSDEIQVVLSFDDVKNKSKVQKVFTFKRGSYAINQKFIIKNLSNNPWSGEIFAQIKHTIMKGKSAGIGRTSYLGAAVSTDQDRYSKISFDSIKEEPYKESTHTGWVSLIQHYFVSSFIPSQGGDNDKEYLFYSRYLASGNQAIIGMKSSPISIMPGETKQYDMTLYSGPKVKTNLEKVNGTLALTIDFGWLWFISDILLWVLIKIHSVLGNWGWSIVGLTLFVKLAFFYLTQSSYRSMAKMRALGPDLARIKEQYSDNKEMLSREMMGLYKREKVNPLGGCLPVLIQMPVFIALYWTLQESVELRHAPFIFWIKNLSAMDPYFVLPILMCLTMFIQQSFNPAPADPVQAKVFKFMPLIFGVMFLWFPAGLTLYWVTNNTLSIAQQWLIKRQLESKETANHQKHMLEKHKK